MDKRESKLRALSRISGDPLSLNLDQEYVMKVVQFSASLAFATMPAHAARLSMSLASGASPDGYRLDIIWTFGVLDGPSTDLGFDARFDVHYPPNGGHLVVQEVVSLESWNTSVSDGLGGSFTELDFFLSTNDRSGIGVSGNGSEFSFVVASILLEAQGPVAGTEISFRHNSQGDPLPAPHDGPRQWQLRWQDEVNGPLQFDIGVGNPGDAGEAWVYHGYETYQPLIVPGPGSLALLALGALALMRPWRREWRR